MNNVTHPFSSADISIFHCKSADFAISRNTVAIWYIISNSFNIAWVFKDFLNKYGQQKWLSPGLLKINVF